MINSKFIAAILLVGSLTSIFDKPVDLLEHDLIDLEKAVEFAQLGDEYEEGEEGVAEVDETDTESDNAKNDNAVNAAAASESIPARVTFRIRGKELFYKSGRTLNKKIPASDVESVIREVTSEKLTVVLVDDYADSKVYRETDALIENLKSELGFDYEER